MAHSAGLKSNWLRKCPNAKFDQFKLAGRIKDGQPCKCLHRTATQPVRDLIPASGQSNDLCAAANQHLSLHHVLLPCVAQGLQLVKCAFLRRYITRTVSFRLQFLACHT